MLDGYVFVPKTPTPEMFKKWREAHCVPEGKLTVFRGNFGNWTHNYRLMLEGVPEPVLHMDYNSYQAFKMAELEKDNRKLIKALKDMEKLLTDEQKMQLQLLA